MIAAYKFFMTPMCPDCGEVPEYLPTVGFKGEVIDATTDEGHEEAQKLGVMGVPMMIFVEKDGKEVNRADNIDDIKKVLENKSLLDI